MATGRPMARAMVFLAMLLVLPGVAQAQSGGSAPGGSAPGGASGAGVPTTRVPATRVPATGTSVVQDHGYLTLPARTSQDVLDQVTREAGRVQGVGRGSSSAGASWDDSRQKEGEGEEGQGEEGQGEEGQGEQEELKNSRSKRRMSDPERPEDRLPELEAPVDTQDMGDLSRIPERMADPVPVGTLVSINKSGVKPQVLKQPKGAGSVKGMGLTFKTNLQTGSASLGVPISLPPARRGLGPDLSLGYSSSGAQGVCGLGWSFGVGFIARQTDKGLPLYDDDLDHFVYNGGRELTRVEADGETLPAWANADYYYRAKFEGLFMRFFLQNANTPDAYWVAQDTDGTLYYFGATEQSADTSALICDGPCERIFRWNLILVEDVHGNRVRYDYEKSGGGQSYLTDVFYNNHPTDPDKYQHHVEMTYEGREDVLTSYQTGFPVTTEQRLDGVYVYTDYGWSPFSGRMMDNDGRLVVRHYALRYQPQKLHSLLEEVEMCGWDLTTCLPPATFTYSEVAGTHSVSQLGGLDGTILDLAGSPDESLGDGRRDLLDVDGDGLPDVYETDPTQPGTMPQYILNNGYGIPAGAKQEMAGGGNLMLWNTNVRLMDVDGDGRVEMMHMPNFGSYSSFRLNCQEPQPGEDGSMRECWWESPETADVNSHIDLTTDAEEIRLVDINGDGLTDVVRTAGTRMEHWLNLSAYEGGKGRFGQVYADGTLSDSPITSCPLHKGTYINFSDPRIKLADMNGDGLQDIVLVDYGTFVYWPNKGFGQWGEGGYCGENDVGSNRYVAMQNAPYFSSMDPTKVWLGDINGDGLADMIQVRAQDVDIWLNAIDGFKDRAIISQSPWAPQFTNRLRLADINGSGSRDILWGDGGNYRYMDLTGGIKPRIITKVENGLGGVTEISYHSSTEEYLRDREAGREWKSRVPFPTQVVTEVRSRDQFHQVGAGWTEGVYTTRYYYHDGHYDGIEHEFRGFGEVTEEKLGDANSPTSYVTHHYYQGKEDEALSGLEYRTDVWAASDPSAPLSVDPVHPVGPTTPDHEARKYLSTSWTAFAVRSVKTPHALDLEPGKPAAEGYDRRVRFAYAKEAHSFGYNTAAGAYAGSGHTQSGLPQVSYEGPAETDPASYTADVTLPAAATVTTHIKTTEQKDDYGHSLEKTAYGEVGSPDQVLTSHATYVKNEEAWILRPCETWTTAEGDDTAYNHVLVSYDDTPSTWGGSGSASAGTATCQVGEKGLSTKAEFKIYYDGGEETIEQSVTDYTAFGLPRHSIEYKKMENWLYYEAPGGYQALATREVIRVGTDGPVPGENPGDPDRYPDTPVKYLSIRVSYDPGLGAIVEYRDENAQKAQAVYDPLGRITQMWAPHVPRSGCEAPQVPSVQIDYYTAQDTGAPYSFVHTRTSEDRCDPSQMQEAFAYVDGLGRSRLAVTEGDQPATAPGHTEWIASDYKEFDGKGAVARTLTPGFISWAPAPGPNTPPQPLQEQNCTDDESIGPTSVCATHIAYDAFGRKALITLADGTTTKTTYHGPLVTKAWDGNDTNPSSPYANTPSTTQKDGHGRTIRLEQIDVDPNGSNPVTVTNDYYYSPLGNLGEIVQDSGGKAVSKTQVFDSIGQKRVINDPAAGTWTLSYDDAGNLIQSIDANGNVIEYGYDLANRLIWEDCVSSASPTPTCVQGPEVRYFYDSPYRTVGGRGYMPFEVSFYNAGEGFGGYGEPGDDVPQDYMLGRLSWVEDETGTLFASYDRLGKQVLEAQRIHEMELPETGVTVGSDEYFLSRTHYDDLGRVVAEVYPDDGHLMVVTEYDNRGNISRIRGPESDPSAPGYIVYLKDTEFDAQGRRTRYCLGDDAQTCTDITFDRVGRRHTRHTRQESGDELDLIHRRFAYDGASNITEIYDLRDYAQVAGPGGYAEENAPYDLSMEYDGLYRLKSATYTDTSSQAVRRKMTYTYDHIGNILSRETQDASAVNNPAEEFYEKWFTSSTFDPSHPHRVTSVHGATGQQATLTYDANGNVTTLHVENPATGKNTLYTYTWDHYNRLITAKKEEGGTLQVIAEHRYDLGNQRVVKVEDSLAGPTKTAYYITEGFEIRSDDEVLYVFGEEKRLARIDAAGNIRTFANDHLGSTSIIADWTGDVLSTTSHLPFGAIEKETGPEDDPYKFTGKELEREFGLYYFGARYLNPQLGRWMSVDPLAIVKPRKKGVSLNGYEYGENSPHNVVDRKGTQTQETKNIDVGFSVNPNAKDQVIKTANEMIKNNGIRNLHKLNEDFAEKYNKIVATRIEGIRKKGFKGKIVVRNVYIAAHGGSEGIKVKDNKALRQLFSGRKVKAGFSPKKVIHVGCGTSSKTVLGIETFFGKGTELWGASGRKMFGTAREVKRIRGMLKMNQKGTAPVMSKLKRGIITPMPYDTYARVKGRKTLLQVGQYWNEVKGGKRRSIAITTRVIEKVSEAIKLGVFTKQTRVLSPADLYTP